MRNIGFILVYVDDVAASVAFYASLLGRPAVESSPTFAMLPAAPGLVLGLWKRDGVKPAASEAGGGEIAFPVENPAEVDAAFAEWRGRGVKSRSSQLRWISATPSSPSIRTASASAFSRRRRTERRAGGGRFVGKAGNNAFACVNQKCRLCSTSIGELADPGPRGRSIRRRDKSAGEKNDLNRS